MNEFIVCLYLIFTFVLAVCSVWIAYNYLKSEVKDMQLAKSVKEFLMEHLK